MKTGVRFLNVEKDVYIIIPSLSPDGKLLDLLADLRNAGFSRVVVINDGSTADYDLFFQAARIEYGCTVLTHAVNQGKGRALKTAFNYLLSECPDCRAAVTVDSDGQHLINDIRRVAQETLDYPEALIMGCRDFSDANHNIPARSRFGNVTTSRVLRLLCGITLSDTQTGLRGFSPHTMRLFLRTKGERFEYEMNMILDAKENGIPLREIPIETVYIEENRTSHFSPLKDSLRIYAVFAKFIVASFSSFLLDMGLYVLIMWLIGLAEPTLLKSQAIFVATILARVLSALFNYFVNKNQVFKNPGKHGGTMLRYGVLCVCQMLLSAYGTSWLYSLLQWKSTAFIKLVVDGLLFLVSFRIQRGWVFKKK